MPRCVGTTVTTAEDTAIGITLAGTDVEGDALTFAVDAADPRSADGCSTESTYTPAAGYNGPDSFTFNASDAAEQCGRDGDDLRDIGQQCADGRKPVADFNRSEDSPMTRRTRNRFSDVDVATSADVLTYTLVSNDNPTVVVSSIAGSTLTLAYIPNKTALPTSRFRGKTWPARQPWTLYGQRRSTTYPLPTMTR
jgi:hypothetical protein